MGQARGLGAPDRQEESGMMSPPGGGATARLVCEDRFIVSRKRPEKNVGKAMVNTTEADSHLY
jgi:hypothetical protein